MTRHSRSATVLAVLAACLGLIVVSDLRAADQSPFAAELRPRLERALDRWCRWLSGYLYRVPGTDLYTLNPTLGTGANPYRDIAGNQFAAAAAGYWLSRANPEEQVARPLRGLVKLGLGTHVAVKAIDRPDIQLWGASLSNADNWHADLFAAAHGMLLKEALPPEQQRQLLAILAWEADRQVEYGISKQSRTMPGLWPAHSCGESNAWSCALLQVARLALPDSPGQQSWRNSAIEYSANTICMPVDMSSEIMIAGRMLKDLVKGANFEPGGIQEHHGFYHPGYEGWTLAYMAYAYLLDRQLPEAQRDPDVYLHNWKYVYDRLKQSTLSNGRFIYPAGYDWISYGYGNTQFMPAALFAAAEFKDPDASCMVDGWLRMIERQQDAAGGSIQASRLASFQPNRLNDFAWYEAQEGCCLAQALWILDHIDSTDMPQPSTAGQFNQRNVGTYYEPNVRLAWYRNASTFASASWRSALGQWQMLVQPVELPHLLKFNHNGMGILDISGTSRSLSIDSFHIGTFEQDGFWTIGTIGRNSKNVVHGRAGNKVSPLVRQYQAMVVLPEGPILLVDFCQALDQIWVLRDGSLGLRLAADVFNDHKANIAADGQEIAWTPGECDDTWHDLQTRAVTVEKQLSVQALAGEGTFQLLRKRQRPASGEMLYPDDRFGVEESLLSHELYFGKPNRKHPRVVGPDEWFRRNILVLHCHDANLGQSARSLRGQVRGVFPCLVVDMPDFKCIAGINFDSSSRTVHIDDREMAVEPHSVRVFAR